MISFDSLRIYKNIGIIQMNKNASLSIESFYLWKHFIKFYLKLLLCIILTFFTLLVNLHSVINHWCLAKDKLLLIISFILNFILKFFYAFRIEFFKHEWLIMYKHFYFKKKLVNMFKFTSLFYFILYITIF